MISTPPEDTIIQTTTNDREQELEHRLAMLGGVTTNAVEIEAEEDNLLLSFDDPTPLPPPAPVVVEPKKPEPAAVKPNKSALLARIMAAQERAKQAQMKQATTSFPPIQQQSTTVLPSPEQMNNMTINVEQEKDKMMKALNGIVDDAKNININTTTTTTMGKDLKPPPLPPPPQFTAIAPPAATMAMAPPPPQFAAPPITAPPPSFEIFEQLHMKEEKSVPLPPPPPPAFDTIENDILNMQGAQAPSAPPTEESLIASFDGVTPMAPPPSYPAEQEVDTDAYDFDIDGNALSPEEKYKMMEEQRAIMEQIQKQASENKASEAAIRADAFESRMMGNPTMSAPAPTSEITGVTTAVDITNVDPAEVEEQRRIYEEIQKQVRKTQGNTIGDYESPDVAPEQNAFLTTEEARQMEEDRKLAERLQNEENATGTASDFPGRRSRAAASSTTTAAPGEESWWDSLMVGMGMTEDPEEGKRSAEINISRPPGSLTPSQRALHGATTGDDYEREGLLGSGSGSRSPRAARVAESKPMFSCVVDSVSNVATAAAAGVSSYAYGEDDEEVHGIDTTSFLAIPKVGDDRGSSGTYSAIPNDN